MIPTDLMRPVRMVLARLSDPRAWQAWDADRRVARGMDRDARDPQPKPRCCRREGVLWDLAAVYPPGAQWKDTLPPAVFFDGPVVVQRDGIAAAIGDLLSGRQAASR